MGHLYLLICSMSHHMFLPMILCVCVCGCLVLAEHCCTDTGTRTEEADCRGPPLVNLQTLMHETNLYFVLKHNHQMSMWCVCTHLRCVLAAGSCQGKMYPPLTWRLMWFKGASIRTVRPPFILLAWWEHQRLQSITTAVRRLTFLLWWFTNHAIKCCLFDSHMFLVAFTVLLHQRWHWLCRCWISLCYFMDVQTSDSPCGSRTRLHVEDSHSHIWLPVNHKTRWSEKNKSSHPYLNTCTIWNHEGCVCVCTYFVKDWGDK